MQKIRRRKFGEILLAENLISREQLQVALDTQAQTGESVGEVLVRQGVITETDVVRCICTQYQLPFIRPTHYQIDSALLDLFDGTFLYRERIAPLEIIGNAVIIALADIPNEAVEQEVCTKIGKDPYYYFAPTSDVEQLLRAHFEFSQEKLLAIEAARRNRLRTVSGQGAPAAPHSPTHATKSLDSTWESIFDQAEKSVKDR